MNGVNLTVTNAIEGAALLVDTENVCKIVLKGNNVIKVQDNINDECPLLSALRLTGSLSFEGSGSLTLVSGGKASTLVGIMIQSKSDPAEVTVNSGTIKIIAGKGAIGSIGIFAGAYIQNGGVVAVKVDPSFSANTAIYTGGPIKTGNLKFVYNKGGKYTGKAKIGTQNFGEGLAYYYTAKEDGKTCATDVQIGSALKPAPKATLKTPTTS